MAGADTLAGGDTLAVVRKAGEAIRGQLVVRLREGVGEVVEKETVDGVRDVLANVFKMHLEQLLPDAQVKGLTRIKPDKVDILLHVEGTLLLSIAVGKADPLRPDPEPDEEPHRTDPVDLR